MYKQIPRSTKCFACLTADIWAFHRNVKDIWNTRKDWSFTKGKYLSTMCIYTLTSYLPGRKYTSDAVDALSAPDVYILQKHFPAWAFSFRWTIPPLQNSCVVKLVIWPWKDLNQTVPFSVKSVLLHALDSAYLRLFVALCNFLCNLSLFSFRLSHINNNVWQWIRWLFPIFIFDRVHRFEYIISLMKVNVILIVIMI